MMPTLRCRAAEGDWQTTGYAKLVLRAIVFAPEMLAQPNLVWNFGVAPGSLWRRRSRKSSGE